MPRTPVNHAFAAYCCELLASLGPCDARRMFGGWGIATGGLTVALIADLGQGERLWLKTNDSSCSAFEAAGCIRFVYLAQGVAKRMHYHSAPDEAMESPHAMAPWAQRALAAALQARAPKKKRR